MFLLHPDIFLWDFLILLALAVGLSFTIGSIVFLRKEGMGAAARLTAVVCLLVFGSGVLVTVYGAFIEPQLIVVTRHRINDPLAPELRIAVVSDLHAGPYKNSAFVQRVTDAVNAVLPDMVILAGDYVLTDDADLRNLAPLGSLQAPLGVYAVLGNHDNGHVRSFAGNAPKRDRTAELESLFRDLDIFVLRNASQDIPMADGNLQISGIDDLWSGNADTEKVFAGTEPGEYHILISHNPDVINEPVADTAHLIVSGHTHGGQIRTPWGKPVPTLPTTLGQTYDQGIFPLEHNRVLAITRGLGESGPRVRLFAWPEVMVLELRPE